MKIKIITILLVILLTTVIISAEKDSDLDGIPDADDILPFDYDNDGMPDTWEQRNNLAYDQYNANDDPDNDGIINIDEYRQGTNPNRNDKENASTTKAKGLDEETKELMKKVGIAFLAGIAFFLIIWFIIKLTKKEENKIPELRELPTLVTKKKTVAQPIKKPVKHRKKIKKKEDVYIMLPIKKEYKNNFERLKELTKSKNSDIFLKLKNSVQDYNNEKTIKKLKEIK